jgi:hypothetical protein
MDREATEPDLLPDGLTPGERIAVPGDVGRAAVAIEMGVSEKRIIRYQHCHAR